VTRSAPAYRAVVGVLSDVGCRRELNEDTGLCVVPDEPALFEAKGVLVLVADGMGGHAAGEVASRLAAETVRASYYASGREPAAALREALVAANRAVHQRAARDPRLAGMGTTCTALALQGDHAVCAHVGDSRLYLIRGIDIYAMTEDHSVVRDLVSRGVITQAEARHHEDRNVILRAIGTRREVDVSTWSEPLPLRAGDTFLVCSDGLHDLVDDRELLDAAGGVEPGEACALLVRLARDRGGHDNITVAVARVEAAPRGGTPPATRQFGVIP
jgi:protein phosphatase